MSDERPGDDSDGSQGSVGSDAADGSDPAGDDAADTADRRADPPTPARSRPEFGEYASPEEQRAAIRAPVDYSSGVPLREPALPGRDPAARNMDGFDPHAWEAPSGHTPYTGYPPPPARNLGHPVDRAATFALFAVGLINILSGAGRTLNLSGTMTDSLRLMGVSSTIPDTPDIARLGALLVISQLVLWVAALAWSIRRVMRGRLAFWIPLLAAVLAGIVMVTVYAVILLHDPGFVQFVQQQEGV